MRRASLWLAAALVAVLAVAVLGLRGPMAGKAPRLAARLSEGTDAVAATPPPPTRIGINVTKPTYYTARAFANLALGSNWAVFPGIRGAKPLPRETSLEADGELKPYPDGYHAVRRLTPPDTGGRSVRFRCTWSGRGEVKAIRPMQVVSQKANMLVFDWTTDWTHVPAMTIQVNRIDPANPLRNLDCREAALSPDARFDPAFLKLIAGFKVIRFMDWQNTNKDQPVRWATRHTTRSTDVVNQDGVPIEDMVALAKQTGMDMWVNMPWGADADYVRRFAQLVHDTLPAGQTVYVELGNELWNRGFRTSRLAANEGIERKLSADWAEAGLRRYAQRLPEVMDIWRGVFADRPQRLVRVAAVQHATPSRTETVLGYEDTARHVDALATAPYFGLSDKSGAADAQAALTMLDGEVDKTLASAERQRAIAQKYGKRYIAYEAGQHAVLSDLDMARAVQRSSEMYALYKRYLDGWRSRIGDTIIMFGQSRAIIKGGAWGLVEHDGQPESEAPKLRAVREAMAR